MENIIEKFYLVISSLDCINEPITPVYLSQKGKLNDVEVNRLINNGYLIRNRNTVGNIQPLSELRLTRKSIELLKQRIA